MKEHGPNDRRRRLVVNADDFGRSSSINEAIIRAHREGILTSASLMVNEEACAQAVDMARTEPRLGVGLHLALVCGRPALPAREIPGLLVGDRFTDNPVQAGWRYFADGRLKAQIRAEIHEQFKRFRATGLPLDHVNGHLHMHLHPVVFDILMADAKQLGIERLRLTRDPFRLNARLASGRWFYRIAHWLVYRVLSRRSLPSLQQRQIKHTDVVFGFLQNGLVDETYVARLLEALPPGDSELYSHPCLKEFRNEFAALVSPRIADQVRASGIELIRYQDL